MGQAHTTQQTEETGNQSEVILSLEELIKGHVQSIAKLKDEKKQHADMLKDSYQSDSVYKDLDEKAKAARKTAATLKGQILLMNKAQAQKVKDLGMELKEKKAALSDYLLEYKRMTGATQLELFSGEVGDIVLSAQIIKRMN